jgi:hypothetical protein
VQPFYVRLAQAKRGELGSHLLPAGVCGTEPRADISAAQSYRAKNGELHENGSVENHDIPQDRHCEIEDVAQRGDQQHTPRWKQ